MHQRPQSYLSSVQPGLRWRYLLVVAAISIVVMNAFYWLTTGRTEFEYNPQDNLVGWLILILLTTPLQAAGEEYLFRGYLTQALGSFINQKWVVILISGVLFSLFHGYQDLPLFINRAAFGILMGVLVVLTGGLEAAIAAHAVNNVFAFAYAALDGGVAATKALTSITWTAMAWNLATYAVVGLLAWAVGRAMKVATLTPKVAAATGRH